MVTLIIILYGLGVLCWGAFFYMDWWYKSPNAAAVRLDDKLKGIKPDFTTLYKLGTFFISVATLALIFTL